MRQLDIFSTCMAKYSGRFSRPQAAENVSRKRIRIKSFQGVPKNLKTNQYKGTNISLGEETYHHGIDSFICSLLQLLHFFNLHTEFTCIHIYVNMLVLYKHV